MLTFTVPESLREFLRAHQRIGYEALFQASAGAIKTLAADAKLIGGETPGFLGVLHTWGRQLQYHQIEPPAYKAPAASIRVVRARKHRPIRAHRSAPPGCALINPTPMIALSR